MAHKAGLTVAAIAALAFALYAGCQTGTPRENAGDKQHPDTARKPSKPARPAQGAHVDPNLRAKPTPPPVVSELDDPAHWNLPAEITTTPIGTTRPAPWLDGAERVAALRRGKQTFVVAAGTGWLKVFSADGKPVAETDGTGGAQVLEILVDRDGSTEIVVGRGRARGALAAPASVAIYRFDGKSLKPPEMIDLPPTTRAQIIGVAQPPDQPSTLWVGMFESKYMVKLLRVERAAKAGDPPTVTPVDSIRVPVAIAADDIDGDGASDLVIARPYGETKLAPGDVFTLGAGNKRSLLPTARGARAVAIHDRKVIVADGWHREYGRRAWPLITRITWDGSAWQRTVLARIKKDRKHWGYDRLRIGDINGDNAPDVIAAGNGPAIAVNALEPAQHSVPALGAVEARDAFPADLDGDGRDEVIIAGPNPAIWRAGK